MTVLSVILGVLLIFAGFSCMFTPLVTFLSTGYFITILLLVYGIMGIVRFCKKEAGGLELAVSILAVLTGVIALFRPGQTLIIDGMLLYFIAAWMLIQGVMSIVLSIRVRKESKGWFWGLIAGILGVIVGVISFSNPILTALGTGVMIGIYFIESGFDMIVLGCALGAMENAALEAAAMEAAEDEAE